MRFLPLFVALSAASSSLLAQANCSAGAGPPASLPTQNPFFGNSLYGHPNYPNAPGPTYTGFSFLLDLTTIAAIDITQIDFDFYDDGNLVQVNSTTTITSPNQVGATTTVEVYVIPATPWLGNETNQPAWLLWGTGTLTVANFHQHSPCVFTPPITLPAGQWAIALKIPPTTNGPNPGPLHPMLDPLTTPGVNYVDPVLTIANLQFQREAWTATVAPASHRQNLDFRYTPLAGYANWTSYGTGCGSTVPLLALASRPVVGTTIDFRTTNVLPGSLFSFLLLGFTPDATGLGLGSFGMPGCNLYLQLGSPIVTNLAGVSNGMSSSQVPIPNDPSYSGIVLYGQSAPMAGASFFASNAVCVAFGMF